MKTIVVTALLLTSISCLAQDQVQTRGGQLRIAGQMYEARLMLDNTEISKGESVGYGFPEHTKFKFSIKDTDVILVQDAISASCTEYFFVTIPSKPAKATKTINFGTCDDNPQTSIENGEIVIRMKDNKGKNVIFEYSRGLVRQVMKI